MPGVIGPARVGARPIPAPLARSNASAERDLVAAARIAVGLNVGPDCRSGAGEQERGYQYLLTLFNATSKFGSFQKSGFEGPWGPLSPKAAPFPCLSATAAPGG